ncbi:hypothetical protein CR513_53374, partial [Mucuna pruriens]
MANDTSSFHLLVGEMSITLDDVVNDQHSGKIIMKGTKLHSDGSIDCYKAQLVMLGNKQEYGLDYDETFALVAKMITVCTLLALAASQSWPLH